MKTTTIILICLIVLAGGVVALRLFWGGGEDTWICENSQWVKHGNPQAPMPTTPCKGAPIVITPQPGQGVAHDQAKFEKSKQLAEEAVKNSPTYKFDGFDLQFVSSAELRCSNCWEFSFSFSSRSADYGDRAGQILAQLITPHQTKVAVQEEKVAAVVSDRTFDELHQRFLKQVIGFLAKKSTGIDNTGRICPPLFWLSGDKKPLWSNSAFSPPRFYL